MKLRIFVEPQQGASYATLLKVATAAESNGFDAFFRSDHYQKMGSHVSGLPGPSDAWVTLAGLARDTRTIRLGTLVSSATFRHPGVLAISVANVDEMSGGRVELGLGAGWYGVEHTSHAIPFPPLGDRFGMLEDQLAIITGMWAAPEGSMFTHAGTHHSVTDSPALPKPVQSRVPIVIGGGGPRRTPRLAATFGSEFNLPFQSRERFVEQCDRVRAACDTIGRDPGTMTWSVALVVCVGENDAEIARRAAAIGRDPEELRENGVCGTPAEAVERLREWSAVGADRVYLQVLDLSDTDHLALVARDVMPHV
ncbi:MAG: LLM class F420-dependent oxidoreductase [Ilumatobacteraceae bacterium]